MRRIGVELNAIHERISRLEVYLEKEKKKRNADKVAQISRKISELYNDSRELMDPV